MTKDRPVIGVVGAGVMGAGVVEDLLQHGYAPILQDVEEQALEKAQNSIRRSLSARALFAKKSGKEPVGELLGQLRATTSPEELACADFIIENVPEDIDLKQEVYTRLDGVIQPRCVLIANTSCIPISMLASFTKRPDRVIGVHFMNPVPLKDTVELIAGCATSNGTIETTQVLLGSLDKRAIVVKDSPGFVSNRVLMLTINEAVFLLHEGVASPSDIDAVFKSCFGHKMGPLETADLIGLDTILASLNVLVRCLEDNKFRPCPLLLELVESGRIGRKNGRGFYEY